MVTMEVETRDRQEIVNITMELQHVIAGEKWQNGICLLFTPHTTTGITINENEDPNVLKDLIYALEKIAPTKDPMYTHVEPNMAAHVKASLVGPSQLLMIVDGTLNKGKYQDIYLCEFDGPRTRKIFVTFLPKE